jgi:phosphoenolpyruvate carboxylase
MMTEHTDFNLKDTTRSLGRLLGETIQQQLGDQWLQRIEQIRRSGKAAYKGDEKAAAELKALFSTLNEGDLLTIARAFAQFLNLANIAEQEFNSSQKGRDPVDTLFEHLEENDIQGKSVEEALNHLHIDLVLTAHPTEVTRRTLIYKHAQLANCLKQIHHPGLTSEQKQQLQLRIADLVSQAFGTLKKSASSVLLQWMKRVGDFQ